MTVAEVNTKNRLAKVDPYPNPNCNHEPDSNRLTKVDGRYPHWVAPYAEGCERFSLIFYQTEGTVAPQGPAVFGQIRTEPGPAAPNAAVNSGTAA